MACLVRLPITSLPGVDELLVVHLEDLFHAEAFIQDALEHNGGGPMLMMSPFRSMRASLLAVRRALEVDDHRPPALGATSRYRDVDVFGTPPSFLWRGLLACSTKSAAPLFLRSGAPGFATKALSFYRSPNGVAPLGPRAIIVPYVVISEAGTRAQTRCERSASYAAVSDRVLIGTETRLSFVDLAQFLRT